MYRPHVYLRRHIRPVPRSDDRFPYKIFACLALNESIDFYKLTGCTIAPVAYCGNFLSFTSVSSWRLLLVHILVASDFETTLTEMLFMCAYSLPKFYFLVYRTNRTVCTLSFVYLLSMFIAFNLKHIPTYLIIRF